ncbi:hypothetical protein ACN28S_10435 [Cystobacter fuscus]
MGFQVVFPRVFGNSFSLKTRRAEWPVGRDARGHRVRCDRASRLGGRRELGECLLEPGSLFLEPRLHLRPRVGEEAQAVGREEQQLLDHGTVIVPQLPLQLVTRVSREALSQRSRGKNGSRRPEHVIHVQEEHLEGISSGLPREEEVSTFALGLRALGEPLLITLLGSHHRPSLHRLVPETRLGFPARGQQRHGDAQAQLVPRQPLFRRQGPLILREQRLTGVGRKRLHDLQCQCWL